MARFDFNLRLGVTVNGQEIGYAVVPVHVPIHETAREVTLQVDPTPVAALVGDLKAVFEKHKLPFRESK